MKRVNKQRVDCLAGSVSVGSTYDKKKMVARFDKLSFVSDLGDMNKAQLRDALFRVKTDSHYLVKSYRVRVNESCGLSAMYRQRLEIQDLSKLDVEQNIAMIWFKRRGRVRGEFRLEMSPQHFSDKDITQLIFWLADKSRLGEMMFDLLNEGWLTSIHYALDIYGMRLSDYLIGMKRCSKGEVRKDENGMEGIVLGHSSKVASIYEKVDVRPLSKKDLVKVPCVKLQHNEYEEFLRIEMRFRPAKGELKLGDIKDMPNLLGHLAFYDKAFLIDPKLDPQFVKALDTMVMPVAMKKHKVSREIDGVKVSTARKAAMKRICKLRGKYRVDVFDADKVWKQLDVIIEKLGILGTPQFWNKKLRERKFGGSIID